MLLFTCCTIWPWYVDLLLLVPMMQFYIPVWRLGKLMCCLWCIRGSLLFSDPESVGLETCSVCVKRRLNTNQLILDLWRNQTCETMDMAFDAA
jgi:hypothetical protein